MSLKFVRNIIVLSFFAFAGLIPSSVYAAEKATQQVSVNQSNGNTHTVAKGETVYSIAKAYNIPVEKIYQSNPSASNGIKVGDVLTIPAKKTITVTNYTVKSKETLYSISKQFGVSVDDILNLNPDLKTKPLAEGQVIVVPVNKNSVKATATTTNKKAVRFVEHKVEAKETVYGISRQYGTTPETLIAFNPELKNNLQTGSTILVPVTQDSLIAQNSLLDVNALKVGVLLPFINQSQGQSARFVEYYEGLLLSLESLKSKGFSANVFVFDMGSETGTAKLNSLLGTNELKNLDLLIGGVSTDQISILSNFAKTNNIKYVIPFPTTSTVVNSNPLVFQVNETQSDLMASVAKAFANRFANSNVIFVTSQNDKTNFVNAISQQAKDQGIITKSVAADGNLLTNLSSSIDLNRRNIIVAASGSSAVLQAILPALNTLKTQKPSASITLFGQPEWQTYTQYIADYSKYDTYIYSSFFLNESDQTTKDFIANYKKWYNNKSMINTYPKYAALGYDTGLFFFSALMKYGKNFESSLSTNTTPTIQTPFSFRRVSTTGGYLNTGFYFVHYGAEGYIQKIAFAQW